LVKRYVSETGTAWIRSICAVASGNEIYVARITTVEVVSALVRHVPGLAPASLAAALGDWKFDFENQYHRIEITDVLVDQAVSFVESYKLRGYDAVQLAAVAAVQVVRLATGLPGMIFVSADHALNSAAAAEGFTVDNPNLHP
jgi:hypothetical protein